MRRFEWKTILAAAIAGSTLFLATGARAHDDDWRWRHHYKHWHHGPERVVVEREPIFVERPRAVYVAPAPVMMMAPMMPSYSPPMDPSLNLNFNIPLR